MSNDNIPLKRTQSVDEIISALLDSKIKAFAFNAAPVGKRMNVFDVRVVGSEKCEITFYNILSGEPSGIDKPILVEMTSAAIQKVITEWMSNIKRSFGEQCFEQYKTWYIEL